MYKMEKQLEKKLKAVSKREEELEIKEKKVNDGIIYYRNLRVETEKEREKLTADKRELESERAKLTADEWELESKRAKLTADEQEFEERKRKISAIFDQKIEEIVEKNYEDFLKGKSKAEVEAELKSEIKSAFKLNPDRIAKIGEANSKKQEEARRERQIADAKVHTEYESLRQHQNSVRGYNYNLPNLW